MIFIFVEKSTVIGSNLVFIMILLAATLRFLSRSLLPAASSPTGVPGLRALYAGCGRWGNHSAFHLGQPPRLSEARLCLDRFIRRGPAGRRKHFHLETGRSFI